MRIRRSTTVFLQRVMEKHEEPIQGWDRTRQQEWNRLNDITIVLSIRAPGDLGAGDVNKPATYAVIYMAHQRIDGVMQQEETIRPETIWKREHHQRLDSPRVAEEVAR